MNKGETIVTLPDETLVDELISKLVPQDQKHQSKESFPRTGSKAGDPSPEAKRTFPPSGDKSGTVGGE